jgi:hypothetical protein
MTASSDAAIDFCMNHSLGIDRHKTYYISTGRPVGLVANGRVLTSLLAN